MMGVSYGPRTAGTPTVCIHKEGRPPQGRPSLLSWTRGLLFVFPVGLVVTLVQDTTDVRAFSTWEGDGKCVPSAWFAVVGDHCRERDTFDAIEFASA